VALAPIALIINVRRGRSICSWCFIGFLMGLPYQREPPEEEELRLMPELLPELLLDPELLPMPDDEP